MTLTYDQFKIIDDARAEAEKAQNAIEAVQDKLESLAYVFSEVLKQAGYGPAKDVTNENCVEFFDSLMEKHGGEDDVVEEIVEGLKPVDSEVPFEQGTSGSEPANVYEQFQDLYEEFPEGTLVKLEYLPTERSRKWRSSGLHMKYTYKGCLDTEAGLRLQEGWNKTRWVEA